MHKIHLSALVVAGLLMTGCGTATNVNVNTDTPLVPANVNSALTLNANVSVSNAGDAAAGTSLANSNAAGIMDAGVYTAAQVATHSIPDDCYASVAGEVYNLTQWVKEHPGGPDAISAVCGKDLTEMKHPGGASMADQVQLIQEFKIGTLAQ